jgi:hypothetical protein
VPEREKVRNRNLGNLRFRNRRIQVTPHVVMRVTPRSGSPAVARMRAARKHICTGCVS